MELLTKNDMFEWKPLPKYVIKPMTIAIIPKYDKHGYLYSIVVEGRTIYLVDMTPNMIMEYSLLNFGSNLKGANASSRFLLGNCSMVPIKVCSKLDIFWFPCKSPNKKDCIWLAHGHVLNFKQVDNTLTNVYLSYGHSVTVDMNKNIFEKKFDKATKLRYILTNRGKSMGNTCAEPMSGYQICKDPKKNDYMINREEGE
jgi:competence protein ComK